MEYKDLEKLNLRKGQNLLITFNDGSIEKGVFKGGAERKGMVDYLTKKPLEDFAVIYINVAGLDSSVDVDKIASIVEDFETETKRIKK